MLLWHISLLLLLNKLCKSSLIKKTYQSITELKWGWFVGPVEIV